MPPFPADLAGLQQQLADAYGDAWRVVVAEQQRVAQGLVLNPRLWRQRDRLQEIRDRIEFEMANVDVMARHWVSREYPRFYAAGAQAAAEQLHFPFTWTQPHREALALLARDTFDDLLEATAFVREDTKRFLREVVRKEVVTDQLVGKTAKQTARNVTRYLNQRGIASVIYKNGARHGLADYADMAIRTKTAVAYNIGTLNQGAEFGVKFYEVFDGPSCGWTAHDDIELANGKIVSSADASTVVIAHPRCARSFGPRPDLATAAQAKAAQPTAGGQHLARPEAPRLPLEAAARTREAREAARTRRAAAGLVARPRTPQAVLARRAAMLQTVRVPGGVRPRGPAGGERPAKVPKWRRDFDKAVAQLDPDSIPTSSRVISKEMDVFDLIRVDGTPSKLMLEREASARAAGKALDDEITKRATAVLKRDTGLDSPAVLQAEWDKLAAQLKDANTARFQYEVRRMMEVRRENPEFRDASRNLQRAWLRMNDPEMARLIRAAEELEDRALTVGRARDAAERPYALAYRDAAREVLGEVRPMGGQLRYGTEAPTRITTPRRDGSLRPYFLDDDSVTEVKEALDSATDFYPQAWLDRANTHHELRVGRTDRGYQGDRGEGVVDVLLSYSDDGIVRPGDPKMLRVAAHELGHAMESADERIRSLEWTFYQRRTSTMDRRGGYLKNQEKAVDMGGGMEGEMARPDKFRSIYMGKDYGGGPGGYFELLAMGMEGVFTGTNRLTWMDNDYRHFILGLLGTL